MNQPPKVPSRPLPSLEQYRVLIVDDDPTMLQLLKDIFFGVSGVEVLTASQPSEAMETLTHETVDIVFTDVHMPGVTGIEMVKDMIALQKTPEIVVMTAYPSGDIAQQAMELGATALIGKPFEDISMVEAELKKAIERVKKQRQSRPEVEQKRAEIQMRGTQEVDNDAMIKVSLNELPAIPIPVGAVSADERQPQPIVAPMAAETAVPSEPSRDISKALPVATQSSPVAVQPTSVAASHPHIVHSSDVLKPLIQIEIQRSQQSGRLFHLGLIDLPDHLSFSSSEEVLAERGNLISKVCDLLGPADAVFDLGRDGLAVVLFEVGDAVVGALRHRLVDLGLSKTGFACFSPKMAEFEDVFRAARSNLSKRRRLHILLYEAEEFFARIVENMLLDPKYHFSWAKAEGEVRSYLENESDEVALLIMSINRDPKQWQLLLDFKSRGALQFPILLFTDVPLTSELKAQLKQLGVRCAVSRGVSQEEFLYIVQSLVIPKGKAEERRSVRALVRVPLVYEVAGRTLTSNSFTLSRDGVFIRDMNPPVAGTWVKLKIFIPGHSEPFDTEGEVIYAVPYYVGVNRFHVSGMAVRFLTLPENKREHIDQFVGACLTNYLI